MRIERLRRHWPTALSCGVALWAMRHAFSTRAPAGVDVAGHLARLDWGLTQIVGHGRLDGWYPRSMLGYQEFLVYPPGFTWLVALTRAATLGRLDTEGALTLLTIAAFVAVAPAGAYLARGMGIAPHGAIAVGMLALGVSSPRGGGIEAMFVTGLVTQHVAFPMAIAALGALAHTVRCPTRRSVGAGVGAGVGVLLTSPVTAVLVAYAAPLVIAVAAISAGRPRGAHRRRAAIGVVMIGLGVAGLAGFWLVPFLVHDDVRGYITSWDQPSFAQHVRLVRVGRRGAGDVLAAVLLASSATVALVGVLHRRVAPLALALLGPVALAGAHALQHLVGTSSGIGNQLTNRGLTLYLVLGLLPVGTLASWVVPRARTRAWAVPVVAAAIAVVALRPLAGHAHPAFTPGGALRATAQHLHDHVEPSARFVVLEHGAVDLGVPAPAQWLIGASDRNALNPFFAEGAPGATLAARVATADITTGPVDRWLNEARLLAVTHVVTTTPAQRAALVARDDVRPTMTDEPLAVFALTARPGSPVGSLLDLPDPPLGQEITRDGVSIRYRAASSTTVNIAIGWSPRWGATVDGRTVRIAGTPDDRVAADLPEGTHTLELRLRPDTADHGGRAVSVATALALLASTRPRRAGCRSEPRNSVDAHASSSTTT